MKKVFYIILSVLFISMGMSAQRQVRRSIKKGNEAFKKEYYNEAENKYKEALRVNPSSKISKFNLGNAYYREQKWDEALQQYQQYVKEESQDSIRQSEGWSCMGNTYLKKVPQLNQSVNDGNSNKNTGEPLKQAIDAYKKALIMNPNDDDTRYNLAVAQKILQDNQNKKKDNKDNKKKNDKDKKKDKNKNKDKNKDKKNQDKNKNDQDKKKNDQDKKNQDKKDENNQMSKENAQQLLNAIEQQEKSTQAKVQQARAQEQKKKNEQNRKTDQDW